MLKEKPKRCPMCGFGNDNERVMETHYLITGHNAVRPEAEPMMFQQAYQGFWHPDIHAMACAANMTCHDVAAEIGAVEIVRGGPRDGEPPDKIPVDKVQNWARDKGWLETRCMGRNNPPRRLAHGELPSDMDLLVRVRPVEREIPLQNQMTRSWVKMAWVYVRNDVVYAPFDPCYGPIFVDGVATGEWGRFGKAVVSYFHAVPF